jgi:hypothetical protein
LKQDRAERRSRPMAGKNAHYFFLFLFVPSWCSKFVCYLKTIQRHALIKICQEIRNSDSMHIKNLGPVYFMDPLSDTRCTVVMESRSVTTRNYVVPGVKINSSAQELKHWRSRTDVVI